MLLAHRLNPVLAIIIVAIAGLASVGLIIHAISSTDFTSVAQYQSQTAQAGQI